MVYLLDPVKPLFPQLKREIVKEIEREKPAYLIIGASTPDIAEMFVFPELKTVWVLNPEADDYTTEEFAELRKSLAEKEITVLKGKHLIESFYHSSSRSYRTLFPAEVMSATLADLPRSVKHCLENAVLTVDKQIVPSGSLVISVAGENDIPGTAVLLEPRPSKNMIDSRIVRIICYPYERDF
jgi:hypothetical protein